MFGVGGQELILLMLIGLIVLGPERLPRIANQMGSWLGQARRMTRVMKRQLEEELDLNKPPTIQPPPAARQPSFKPPSEVPSEDAFTPPDATTPAAGEDTASAEEKARADRDAAEAEHEAVIAAQESAPPEAPADEEPKAS